MRRACWAAAIAVLLSLAPVTFQSIKSESRGLVEHPSGGDVQARTQGISDVPVWRVNDNWVYDGYLDVADFAADSGVSTNVETLNGSLSRTVQDIYISNVDENETLVYEVQSVGSYQSDGSIDLDGNSGCLYVDMETTEVIRTSDLATFSQQVSIDVYFDPWCWSALRQTVGVLSVLNTFTPPLENYDFPISVGESWEMSYQQETEYDGESNFGIEIPDDTNESNSTSWTVVNQGNSGVSFPGCYQSFNVTSYDSNGDESGFNWYCPHVKGEVRSSIVQAFGFVAVHNLVTYQPVQGGKEITIDVQYPISPTGIETLAWINATEQGQAISDLDIQFRYESETLVRNVSTDANGTIQLEFNSGSNPDDSIGEGELGSHGLVAWIESEGIIGASTLIIDSDVHQIDLVSRSSGVSVQRFRPSTGNEVSLDPSMGFSAVRGDVMTFSLQVMNRGLNPSPETTIVVDAPDGSEVTGHVPQLASLQESRVEVNWTVPENHPFGNVYIYFEVDPDEISGDGNRSNNEGSFVIFVGSLPTPSLQISPTDSPITLEEVNFDGTSSLDPDGGSVYCRFSIFADDGAEFLNDAEEEDCEINWSWGDDGLYHVVLIVSDDEGDSSSTQSSISVQNQPPVATIGSETDEIEVTNPITFTILESWDLDSQNPEAPVEFLWGAECSEGRVSTTCTVTPMIEGEYSIEVLATDDDGATTLASHSINVSNIAPSNPVVELYLGDGGRIFPDSRGVFTVNEGQEVTFLGQAEDSVNDLDSLLYVWVPDAETSPDVNYTSAGLSSSVSNISYNSSGMHLATFQAFDDDGEGSELLIIPIQVSNVAPEIAPLTTDLGNLEEDEVFRIEPGVSDTPNDIDDLTLCFDLDTFTDSDADGQSENDCDIPGGLLIHSWPDSSTASGSITFHVTDDDGDYDSVEIYFSVTNSPPEAFASSSEENPSQGEAFVLSANGTIDSAADMDSLIFNWDVDIFTDSDGDGDPANDVDFTGRWVEVSYRSGGMKQAKLTVLDDSSSHSIIMDIEVAEAPTSLSKTIQSNLGFAILCILLVAASFFAVMRLNVQPKSPEGRGHSFDMDSAFDETNQTFEDNETHSEAVDSEATPYAEPSINALGDVFEELTGTRQENKNPIPLPPAPDLGGKKHDLDPDDIEALFEE